MTKEKILLGLLPYWTPMIPPMGISCLKSFLQPYGYNVKTFDLNVEAQFQDIYKNYFSILEKCLPENKKGNFYNIGHDVLQNHMMAHLYDDKKNERKYIELIKVVILKNYYYDVEDSYIRKMNVLLDEFYQLLDIFTQRLLAEEIPAVFGLSVYRGTLPASLFAFKVARDKFPHIKTIMGGGIFSQELGMGSDNLKYFLEKTPFIDVILIGEAEYLFLEFLEGKLPADKKVYSMEDTRHRLLDLSSVKTVDFSDFNLDCYPYMANYVSRSCPFQCTFCAETIFWGKYRLKDARQVVNELLELYRRHYHRLFWMCDSLLNPVITKLAEEVIKSGELLYWDGYLRVDKHSCNSEKTLLWRKGGFYRARIGVESGSPKILKLMNKQITPAQVKESVANLAGVGIKTCIYIVVGYPGETEDDFRQTLALLEELKDDIYEARCNPFRYFETGQANSAEWAEKSKSIPLYPEALKEPLMMQTLVLLGEPSREETMERVNRFEEHRKRLGIPNPFSMQDILNADERWKKLHKNSVPSVVEFRNNKKERG